MFWRLARYDRYGSITFRFRESPAGPQCPRSRRSHEQGGIDEKGRIRTLLEQPTEQAIPHVQASSEGLADFPHCLLKDRSIQLSRATAADPSLSV
jgi:hypothetical protein